MAIHFHKVKVRDIRRETADCVSISLQIPQDLRDSFQYLPGQYLNFKIMIDGKEVRRSYSLCSAPYEEEWRVAVKKVPGGIFSTYAHEILRSGDVVEVMPPSGNFVVKTDAEHNKHYLAFASGSGITPVISIIKSVLLDESKSVVTLFYGNRYGTSIIFREQLEGLKNLFLDRFRLYHILSKEKTDASLFHGRINRDKCKSIFEKLVNLKMVDQVFLCGPEEMIFELRDYLNDLKFQPDHIHYELFTVPGQKKKKLEHRVNGENEKNSQVQVILDGTAYELDVPYRENILDAAVERGLDLPFSCKGGVCSTCRAKLVKGDVEMAVNYALEREELEDNFVLCCQSFPRSEKVEINFDIR